MLTIENLSLSYGTDSKVLSDITLKVKDGECVLLTGESGSGKSSVINSINGLAFEYENAQISGSIKVGEKEIKNLELYEISLMIASVFQNPKTHFFNLDKKEMESRMNEMLDVFKIDHLLGRSIFELSGGEKQILCVAAAYISGCKIIVLDEPSSNLDENYIDILKEMLIILKNKGITLILAEHRIYYLMDVADRIIIIQNGRIAREYTALSFLSVTDAEIAGLGLRSRYKTVLNKPKNDGGKDLIIKKLSFNFANKGELEVDDVSLDFGKIYGIIGKNGCGKSTFLSVMTGLLEKGKCEIEYDGEALSRKERLKQSSLVMQDVNYQLFADSVEEEMRLGVKKIEEDRINQVLSGLGLAKLRDRHPMSLSGGQKQRVAIASVLCKNSRFIFFDEPTSGMDYKNMLKISKLIKSMKTEDNIIFIVSHDTELLNEVADSILCLQDYRIYN